MPAITSGRVLVTGGSGFLALYVIRALLERGFSVRYTVRSESKAAFVDALFKEHAARLEAVIVADMALPGAYDAAVPGVDGIVHVASPVDVTNAGAPELVTGPAVGGVTGLAESVAAHGGALKRWVQVSSVGALGADFTQGAAYAEADWNDESVRVCAELGAGAEGIHKYNASKVLAERAFWAAAAGASWDGVSVLPSMIMAPELQYALSGASVGLGLGLAPLVAGGISESQLGDVAPWHIVDARDVGHVVVAALTTPEAGGERFIASNGILSLNDVALAAGGAFDNVVQANPDPAFAAALPAKSYVVDGSKAERVLGFTYRPVRETLEDTLASVPREVFAPAPAAQS
ncbi:hypothetical protein Q8F55_002415 [Vanrija albida]|uniref:NAD-dependent epimerase/dehydratase domain-containing protein n=1 Tax=Vanrija albida TaxID=181172 RepID=A0ABR3Q9R5_9TREE